MVLILEVPIAGIALVLTLVSWMTLRAIRRLDVGKSFWIPLLLSGSFFLAGSIVAILDDLGLSLTGYMAEISAIIKLLALCTLLGGIYAYSRKITKHLTMDFTLPAPAKAIESSDEKAEISVLDREQAKERAPAKDVECKYKFGYLQTLRRSAAIPDACLKCQRIIECKHPYLRKAGEKTRTPPSETVSDVMISDTDIEEETAD